MAIIKVPTLEQRQEAEDGYAIVVGRVSLLWAKIHEDFARFYIDRFTLDASKLAELAWYSHRSDSGQRELLKKTIERNDIRGGASFPMAKDDLVWSIDRISALSKIRNDAIHATVALIWGESGPQIAPDPWSTDPRSEKLRNVDLLTRLKTCQKDLEELLGYNRLMFTCFFDPVNFSTWPSRPRLTS